MFRPIMCCCVVLGITPYVYALDDVASYWGLRDSAIPDVQTMLEHTDMCVEILRRNPSYAPCTPIIREWNAYSRGKAAQFKEVPPGKREQLSVAKQQAILGVALERAVHIEPVTMESSAGSYPMHVAITAPVPSIGDMRNLLHHSRNYAPEKEVKVLQYRTLAYIMHNLHNIYNVFYADRNVASLVSRIGIQHRQREMIQQSQSLLNLLRTLLCPDDGSNNVVQLYKKNANYMLDCTFPPHAITKRYHTVIDQVYDVANKLYGWHLIVPWYQQIPVVRRAIRNDHEVDVAKHIVPALPHQETCAFDSCTVQ